MTEEKTIIVFNKFIKNCSEQDLNYIIENELSEREKVLIINHCNIEVKQNILENFNVDIIP